MGLIREAIKRTFGLTDIVESTVDADDHLYRPLTQKGARDLDPLKQDQMIKICFLLYDKVGMAKRLINMQTEFILGEGMVYKAKDKRVQAVLDAFWNDSVNAMNLTQYDKVTELALFGEQCYPTFVNEHNGHVQLGVLDPAVITEVVPNPENITQIIGIKSRGKEYKVIHADPDTDLLTGDAFFFTVNNVSTAARGRSDLFPIADYIDGYERFLFNRLERSHLLNSFLWDVTLEGATQKEIDDFKKVQRIPKPGSTRYHNENVKWNTVTPKLEANDASQEARLLRNQILGSFGIPGHYFAEGDKTTRATALEMGTPTFKKFKLRQKYVSYMFQYIFRYVIDQAIMKKVLPMDVDKTVKIVFPKISEKDLSAIATALGTITTSLVLAVDNNFITEEKASEIYAEQISLLGTDIEPEKGESTDQKKVEKMMDEQKRGKQDVPTE